MDPYLDYYTQENYLPHFKGERKSFHDINRLKELMSTKPAWQGILEAIFCSEEKNKYSHDTIERKQMKLKLLKYKTELRTHTRKIRTNKMIAINTHLSTVILNTNGLNFPIKRHRLVEQIKKENPFVSCVWETHLTSRISTILKGKDEKRMPIKWGQEASRDNSLNIWQNRPQINESEEKKKDNSF